LTKDSNEAQKYEKRLSGFDGELFMCSDGTFFPTSSVSSILLADIGGCMLGVEQYEQYGQYNTNKLMLLQMPNLGSRVGPMAGQKWDTIGLDSE
jgi:hypothetical protein